METLFEQVTSWTTLVRAFDRVEDNRGAPGVDGQTVEDFAGAIDAELAALRAELIAGTYQPRPLQRVWIVKDDGRHRALAIPTVRDRVAQTAVAMKLTSILDPDFSDASFGYRRGRSVDQAVRRVIALRNQGYRWVLDADIERFFDEIPHDLLLAELARRANDSRLLRLVEQWLGAEVQQGPRRERMEKGVAQGSPLSPLLANVYLDRFDDVIERRGRKLVRFADDFVILCKNRPAAESALDLSEEVLDSLRLALSPEKTRITNFDQGFRFLGVQFLKSLAFRPRYEDESEPIAVPLRDGAPLAGSERQEPTLAASALAERPLEATSTAFEQAMREAIIDIEAPEEREAWESVIAASVGSAGTPTADHDPLLRTLYLLEQGAELCKEDERFVVRKGSTILCRIPALKVDQILVFGGIGITTPAMRFCLQQDIPIFLLSLRGKYYGVIESADTDKVLLHRDQFARVADPAFALGVAREVARGKLLNSRTVLQRVARRGTESAGRAATAIGNLIPRLDEAKTLDELRGFEGAAAASYFGAWAELVGSEWTFPGRRRQPPTDPVNSLLSFGYTLLYYNAYSLVRARGLHPHVGFFHALRDGHPALVSDVIEEFRSPVIDATVLAMLHRRQVKPGDFRMPQAEGLPCLLTPDGRKRVTRAFEVALNRPIVHPDAGSRCDWRRAIALQVERLTAVIRGHDPVYRPFLIK